MSKIEEDPEEQKLAEMMSKLDMVSVLENKEIYDSIMQSFPTQLGKAVSKKEREELSLKDPNLIYGEIVFDTLGLVFEKIKKVYGRPYQGSSGPSGIMQGRGGIYYDLGAGTGKGVIASAILHNFDVCYGIECLEGLFSLSLDALNSYNTRGKARLSMREHDTHCQFIHGDFLKPRTKDWRDADVVFANSTCFDTNLMMDIAKLAVGMKKGSFFITITKRLPCKDFVTVDCEMQRMSWGEASIFIMQKTTDPRAPNAQEEVADVI
ncbi:hypothetical protein EON65_32680 [archaeon]|nr:MAG: hypothetical protein EON65_32680 [archaeon]